MKFYDKYVVVTRTLERDVFYPPFDVDNPPVAFASPYEGNKACERRRETMHQWANQYRNWGEPVPNPEDHEVIFDNVPLSGFALCGVATRYTTDNKLIQIKDPRGFILEISTKNAFELIMESTIINGVFQEELVWARDTSNVLIRSTHPLYLSRNDTLPLQQGDLVKCGGIEMTFIGRGHLRSKDNPAVETQDGYVMAYGNTVSFTKSKPKYNIIARGNGVIPSVIGDLQMYRYDLGIERYGYEPVEFVPK